MMKLTVEDVVAEFNRPVLVNEHGCWLWMGATDNYGYARYGGNLLVYGYLCRKVGKISPIGTDYLHQCSNHNCINPDHFLVGTNKENMNDDNRKAMGPKGRLTDVQINELALMLEEGIYTKTEIAHKFGVSKPWITKFLKGGFKYAKAI